MSTDDRTDQEWGVRYPDSHVEGKMMNHHAAIRVAEQANKDIVAVHGAGVAEPVTRIRSTTFSD